MGGDRQTDICNSRVAFASENLIFEIIRLRVVLRTYVCYLISAVL